jgi:hypothetical protein
MGDRLFFPAIIPTQKAYWKIEVRFVPAKVEGKCLKRERGKEHSP